MNGITEQLRDSLLKREFYPCCSSDIDEPRRLLNGLVDEVIFCDLRLPHRLIQKNESDALPSIRFLQGDVNICIDTIQTINVLFYRNDSASEGGSGIHILGKKWLSRIIQRFPDEGGLIITDGSNSGDHIFKKMIRSNGYLRKSWHCHFLPSIEQPWIETLGLYKIEVKRIF